MTSKQRARGILIVALLAGAVLFVYAQVGGFGFVGLDDNSYVSDNPHVMSGLTET